MRIDGKTLPGKQRKALREALDKAFDKDSLDQMLRESLEERFQRKLTAIIDPQGIDFSKVLNAVIDRADQQSWTAQLLEAALKERPDDVDLHNFAKKFTPVVDTIHLLAMERTIRAKNPQYDINLLVQNLLHLSNCVCHIENYAREHLGTGFLIRPNVVMTNYHVWQEAKGWQDFFCRFDYKGIPNSNNIDEGEIYGLTSDTCVLYKSEYHPDEFSLHGKDVVPSPDQLDVVFLQLNGSPGEELIDQEEAGYLSKRGWLRLSLQEHQFSEHDSLFIIHHPMPQKGTPYFPHPVMKISLETDAILNMNTNRTRIRYRTNTYFGSSGSPCFNADWELVAIHNAGDPDYKASHTPEYNQGIPLSKVRQLLERDGVGHLLEIAQSEEPDKSTISPKNPSTSFMPDESESAHTPSDAFAPRTGLSSESAAPHEQPPIDISQYQHKQGHETIMNQEQLLQEARRLIDEAQKHLKSASTPFTEDIYTSWQYTAVTQALANAEASLQSLERLLHRNVFLPETVERNYISIKDRIDSFGELRMRLVRSLDQNDKGDFSGLYTALSNIDKFIFE